MISPLVRMANGMTAISCRYAPQQGRSGGVLYNLGGELVGVTCYSDPNENSGLYSSARPIRRLLGLTGSRESSPAAIRNHRPRKGPGAVSPRVEPEMPRDADGDAGLSRRLGEVEKKLDQILEASKDR